MEPLEKFNKQLYVYETLVQLQQMEQCAQEAVRKSEAEVHNYTVLIRRVMRYELMYDGNTCVWLGTVMDVTPAVMNVT